MNVINDLKCHMIHKLLT